MFNVSTKDMKHTPSSRKQLQDESLVVSLDVALANRKKRNNNNASADAIMQYQCEAIDSQEKQEAFDALSVNEQVAVANDYLEMTR